MFVDQFEPAPIGLVLRRLAAFVADDLALVLEVLPRERVGQRGDPVRLQPEHVFQVARRYGGEVVGAVVTRGTVDAALPQVAARLLDVLEIPPGRVFRPFEHQVFKEMGEPGAAGPLHLGAHVKPVIDMDHGQFAVNVQNDLQTVRKGKLLKGYPRQILRGHDSSW